MKKYLFIVSILLCTTCTKIELPMIVGEQPIFEVKGTLGGRAIKLAAGVDDQILYTDFNHDRLQILTLTGQLRNKNCQSDCPNSLLMRLRQNARTNSAISLVGRKSFFQVQNDSIMVKTNNQSTQPATTGGNLKYNWTLNDKAYSNSESVAFALNPFKLSTVCLEVTNQEGSVSNQCQTIDLNLIDTFPGLKVSLLPVQGTDKTWSLKAIVSGKGPFKYNWDNKVADQSSIDLEPKNDAKHCLKVTDPSGNVATACVEWSPAGRLKCRAEFDIGIETARLQSWTQYNSAEFIYIDERGVVWNSASAEQRSASVFEITEDKPFEPNDKKQNTRKLKFNLAAILYNKNKESQPIKLEGYMAVAVPQ